MPAEDNAYRLRERRRRGNQFLVGNDAHDRRRTQHVADGRQQHPDDGCDRHVFGRIFNHRGGNRSAFDADKSPQGKVQGHADGGQAAFAGNVPAFHISFGIKPEPAEQCDADDRKQGHGGGDALHAADHPRSENVGVGKKPDDGNLRQRHYQRIPKRREKRRQITEPGHRQTDIADNVGQPVDQVGLIAHIIAEGLARIGIRPAGRGRHFRQLGKHQPERYGADNRNQPADDGDAADAGEVGGQHEHARTHHVSGHHQDRRKQSYLIAFTNHLFSPFDIIAIVYGYLHNASSNGLQLPGEKFIGRKCGPATDVRSQRPGK